LPASQAYLDGELRGVRPDGTTSFSIIQTASDTGNAAALVFFLFDLLYLDGEALASAPLRDRKERLRDFLSGASAPLQFSDHQVGRGQEFYEKACELAFYAGRAGTGSSRPSSSGCGTGCNHLPRTKCRSMCRRHAPAASAHPWC
jgi:bifunctional non-homologous end joining protein LigD